MPVKEYINNLNYSNSFLKAIIYFQYFYFSDEGLVNFDLNYKGCITVRVITLLQKGYYYE